MTSAKIRFHVSKPVLAGREAEYSQDALASGWISSSGAYIGAFEARVASFLDADEGIAMCNGTAALHLASMGMGLAPGDEVIVPDLAYLALGNPLSYCGARPVRIVPSRWVPPSKVERSGGMETQPRSTSTGTRSCLPGRGE
jgi:perosamine synthetase